jgi:hypothetical protein
MNKKRWEISFESREQWRIFSEPQTEHLQCPACTEESQMLTVENLAILTGTSQLEIFREIERGNLHFIETRDSRLFVCVAAFSKGRLRNSEREIWADR